MMIVLMLNPLDGFNILDHGLNLFAHGTILAQQVNVDIVGDFVRTGTISLKAGKFGHFLLVFLRDGQLEVCYPKL